MLGLVLIVKVFMEEVILIILGEDFEIVEVRRILGMCCWGCEGKECLIR